MPVAAARVGVDQGHQLAHAGLAVADHHRRVAPRGGHEVLADHQQAEIAARQIALDHDVVAKARGVGVAGDHLLARAQVHRHALALVAVTRLDDHRQADFQRRRPGVLGAGHRAPQRHRHASGVEQLLGQVLVLRDGFGDGAGRIQFGGLDAPLLAAPAELHQASLRQAPVRDAARRGGLHDGAGGGAEADLLVQLGQALECGLQVERRVVLRGAAQLFGQFQRLAADCFLGVFHDDLEHPGLGGGGGAREAHRAAGLRLQAQRGQLQRVGHGHAAGRARRVLAVDGREAQPQALAKRGVGAEVAFVGAARHDGLDGGAAGPEVGAAQGADAGNVHGGVLAVQVWARCA